MSSSTSTTVTRAAIAMIGLKLRSERRKRHRVAEGRETRVFNGREYLLEHALPLDYAFIRACRVDRPATCATAAGV